jgi:hypothetical protein
MARKKNPPTEPGPLPEDPESQPRKGGKRGRQTELPGVFENAKTYPSIERAMGELSAAMRDYAAAGKVCNDLHGKIKTLMIEHHVPTYVVHDLVCTVDPGEPKLKVKRLKDGEEAEAA